MVPFVLTFVYGLSRGLISIFFARGYSVITSTICWKAILGTHVKNQLTINAKIYLWILLHSYMCIFMMVHYFINYCSIALVLKLGSSPTLFFFKFYTHKCKIKWRNNYSKLLSYIYLTYFPLCIGQTFLSFVCFCWKLKNLGYILELLIRTPSLPTLLEGCYCCSPSHLLICLVMWWNYFSEVYFPCSLQPLMSLFILFSLIITFYNG